MEIEKSHDSQTEQWQPEAEEELGSMPEYEDYNTERAFAYLDINRDIANHDKCNLVGLVGDIKRATDLIICARKEDAEDKSDDAEFILDTLGLKYVREADQSEYDPDYVDIRYYIAKTEEDANRLKELFGQYAAGDSNGDVSRELGHMLGFPKTAIDYFASRNGDDVRRDAKCLQAPSFYVPSPNNSEEEYKQYEEKIYWLFAEYCPLSAKELIANS